MTAPETYAEASLASQVTAAATSSASSQSRSGTLVMSSPARSWNSVCMKPGATTDVRTPVPASSVASDSVNEIAHALVAE